MPAVLSTAKPTGRPRPVASPAPRASVPVAEDLPSVGRPSRQRRASEREALRLQDEADALARKAAKAAKRAEKERRQELIAAAADAQLDGPWSDGEDDMDDEEMTRAFPKKKLTHRTSKVPPPISTSTDSDDGGSAHGDNIHIEDDEDEDVETDSQTQTTQTTGTKRPRSPSPDRYPSKQPKQVTSRPKISNFTPDVQIVIYLAIRLWRLQLYTVNPFPSVQEEAVWVRDVWNQACDKYCANYPLDADTIRVITSRSSHTRGELKTKVKAIVAPLFDLAAGCGAKQIRKMRKHVELLKDDLNFTYEVQHKDPERRKGLYKGKVIQKCVDAMWFANRRDEGVVYHKAFLPFPLPAFALVLTAIENCLDEFATGLHVPINFDAAEYEAVYKQHLTALEKMDEQTKAVGLFDNIRTRLYNVGRAHAGAEPLNVVKPTLLSDAALAAAVKEYQDDSSTETDGEDGSDSE